MNKEILRELLLDEIILANSEEAQAFNKVMRKTHKNGVLEMIYERHDSAMKKIAASGFRMAP